MWVLSTECSQHKLDARLLGYTWHSLFTTYCRRSCGIPTGCSTSPPNQVVVKGRQLQLSSSTLQLSSSTSTMCPHSLFGWLCQLLDYANKLYHLFLWPGVSLPVLKASSDTAQRSNLGSDCCSKSCKNPRWRPVLLDSRTAFKLGPLPLVLVWAISIYFSGHDTDSLTWLPDFIQNVLCGYRSLSCFMSLVSVTEPALFFLFGYSGTASLAHENNTLPVLLSSAPSLLSLMEQPALLLPDWWKVDFYASPQSEGPLSLLLPNLSSWR